MFNSIELNFKTESPFGGLMQKVGPKYVIFAKGDLSEMIFLYCFICHSVVDGAAAVVNAMR